MHGAWHSTDCPLFFLILYGCQAVITHLNLNVESHCSSCHSEMQAAEDGLFEGWAGHAGTLTYNTEYEEVCCTVQEALKHKQIAHPLGSRK